MNLSEAKTVVYCVTAHYVDTMYGGGGSIKMISLKRGHLL